MSMGLQTSAESGCLYVTATGKFTLAEAQRTFVEMIGALVQHKVEKVLFDGRRVDGDARFMERFYFGEFAARTVTDYSLRGLCGSPHFAYVLKEPLLDPGRFGETVAVNQGMHVRAFDKVKEARQWLGIAAGKEGPQ